MIPENDYAPVTLSNGQRLVLHPPQGTGPITLTREAAGRVIERLQWPYPPAGLAGAGLTLSPSEKALLVSYFSGQSEEAYRVISLVGPLRELCSCDYQFGEAASYAFSPGERFLLMALPSNGSEWWLPFDDDELEEDEHGRFIDFASLRLQNLLDGSATAHRIRVYPPDGWTPVRESYDPDMQPQVDDSGRVHLRMPWARLTLDVPIPTIVRVSLRGSALG